MLKIKEDKMQELEKFGFEKIYNLSTKDVYCYYYLFFFNKGEYIEISIGLDRIVNIWANCEETCIDNLAIFYDLFANDMIEKVGEIKWID